MVKDAVPLGECRRALVLKLAPPDEGPTAALVAGVLKAHAPALEVDVHVAPRPARLLSELRLFFRLRARRYDLVVHLTGEACGAWLARSLGARYSVAPDLRGRGAFWRNSFTHLYLVAARRDPAQLDLDALRRIGVYPSAGEAPGDPGLRTLVRELPA